jgi:HK97 family phage major capsid protein
MFKLKEAKEKRAAIFGELEEINKRAVDGNLIEADQKLYDQKKTDWTAADAAVKRAEDLEKMGAANPPVTVNVITSEHRGDQKADAPQRFSLLKAVRDAAEGRSQTGFEAEMQQEAEKEARASGISMSGSVRIPSFVANPEKRTDMVVGTTTVGGHTVQTDLGALIPFLDPRTVVRDAGATYLTGLVGNLDLPRNNAATTATWDTEIAAATETNPTFDKISLTPKRLNALTKISKQLLAQSSVSIENFVRGRLIEANGRALDIAALNGATGGNNPVGVLKTSGIGSVAGGTNGLAPTWANLVALETAIATANADMGKLAYVTTPGIRGKLKTTAKDAGSGLFLMGDTDQINGYKALVSNLVPSTLTKGSSSGVCHAIIFGNWAELIIGQWAGLDLVVDPYSLADKAEIRLIVNSWWDVAVAHAASFAAMQDALV